MRFSRGLKKLLELGEEARGGAFATIFVEKHSRGRWVLTEEIF